MYVCTQFRQIVIGYLGAFGLSRPGEERLVFCHHFCRNSKLILFVCKMKPLPLKHNTYLCLRKELTNEEKQLVHGQRSLYGDQERK